MDYNLKINSKQNSFERQLRQRFNDGFDLIQVILGPRQVGKTTAILNLLKDYKSAFVYISAEESLAPQPDWIDEVWQQALDKSTSCLLVIDEIQKIPNWSERIKKLWDNQKIKKQQKIKLVLLGSSSLKIQQGLSESLTGRHELIRAYHWSFEESQLIKKMNLDDYLLFGGYPGSYKFKDSISRFDSYIQNSIVSTVIEKDLLNESRIKNPSLFKQTFQLLQTLPAAEISYTKLLGQLQDKGNTDLIKNYLDLFEGAFLIKQIHKYNKKAFKTRLSTPKIICLAPSLLNRQQKKIPEFLGLCFESLVGSDLVKANLDVNYWREGDFEIDFVFELNSQLIGLEVKSQKRKSSKSISAFLKEFPKAKILYVNFDNYKNFSKNPIEYISKILAL